MTSRVRELRQLWVPLGLSPSPECPGDIQVPRLQDLVTSRAPLWVRTKGVSAQPLTSVPPAQPHSPARAGPGGHHTKTLARASAPALATRALLGWQATAWMASSCFLRWAVISCTHVLLSRLHRRREQSWPAQAREQDGLSLAAAPLLPARTQPRNPQRASPQASQWGGDSVLHRPASAQSPP